MECSTSRCLVGQGFKLGLDPVTDRNLSTNICAKWNYTSVMKGFWVIKDSLLVSIQFLVLEFSIEKWSSDTKSYISLLCVSSNLGILKSNFTSIKLNQKNFFVLLQKLSLLLCFISDSLKYFIYELYVIISKNVCKYINIPSNLYINNKGKAIWSIYKTAKYCLFIPELLLIGSCSVL